MADLASLPLQAPEQHLLATTCLALFAAINDGRLIVSDVCNASEINQTTALIDACYLVQDVVNGCDRENLGAALQAVRKAHEGEVLHG